MKLRFFDFEVFPNWWCCVFGDSTSEGTVDDVEYTKSKMKIVTSDDVNARDSLLEMFYEPDCCNVGYNIKHYDLIILNAIRNGLTPQQVYIISDMIIRPDHQWASKEHIRLQSFAKKPLRTVVHYDLMDDNDMTSLKQKEAIMGLNIYESNVDFEKPDLTDEDKEETFYYCKHDVWSSMYYFHKYCTQYFNTKLILGKTFNIPVDICCKSTNAQLVGMALGATRKHYDDIDKTHIELHPRIKNYCEQNLPNKVLDYILNNTSELKIKMFGNDVVFGNGGIHSTLQDDLYVESDDEYTLMNVDVASFYPSIMIQLDLLSRAVSNPEKFKEIFDSRIAIKHKKNKTPEDYDVQMAYKLVLNTTFGASGNQYLDLYDPYRCSAVCRVGQILLAALANKLYNSVPTIKIIQTNTDGILIYVARNKMDIVNNLIEEWQNITHMMLEADVVDKIWQCNVNNYLMVEYEDGELVEKCRGAWLKDYTHRQGSPRISATPALISAKAAKEYLLRGTDIIETIVKDNDIRNFVIPCTKGPTYRGVVQIHADGTEVELLRCNRVIATKDRSKGKIYKYKMYQGEKRLTQIPKVPEYCELFNDDLDKYTAKDWRGIIDYTYYIIKAVEMLDINWTQLRHSNLININKYKYELE